MYCARISLNFCIIWAFMASRDLICLNLRSISKAPSADLRVLKDSSMKRFASPVNHKYLFMQFFILVLTYSFTFDGLYFSLKPRHHWLPHATWFQIKWIHCDVFYWKNQTIHSFQHVLDAFRISGDGFKLWTKNIVELLENLKAINEWGWTDCFQC